MNIIERYISAYILHCLFPEYTASQEHIDYVYQVLRESGSNPGNELLRTVLNFTRQGDPADPQIQSEVREYVQAMVFGSFKTVEPVKPKYVARYASEKGYTAMLVTSDGIPTAFAGCTDGSLETCKEKLRQQFPGIVFEEVK